VWNPYLSNRSTALSSSYLGLANPSGICSITYRTDEGQTYTSVNGWPRYVSWCANGYKPDVAKPWAQQCGIGNQSIYPGTQIPVSALTDQSCAVGNPCSVGAGLKRQSEVDFIASGAQRLALKRTYQSSYLVAPLAGFGALWMHEWQRRLDLSKYSGTTQSLAALRADGTSTTFALSGGIWTATDGQGDQVIPVSDAGAAGQGFRLTDRRSDRTEDYDASGKLLVVKERNGWVTSLKYSDVSTPTTQAPHANLLIEVRNQFEQTIRFAYDTSGRINSATMPDGTILLYGYGAYGMLSTVTYAGGAQRQYHYENSQFVWALTGITDENGVRFATYAYDSLGRATSTEHAGGVDKFQLSFLGNGQTSVTTADGTSRTFTSELQGNVLRATGASAACMACGDIAKAVAYDAAGNVASRRDFSDKETRYSYDALGRETQRIEGYGTADAKTTTTEWHQTWNLPLKVAEPGHVEYFSYDASGQLIGYVRYDTTDPTGSQGVDVTPVGPVTSTGWTYDSNGLKSATTEIVDGAVVGQWTYTYDSAGNLLTITDATGRKAQAVQYDAAGRLLEATTLDGDRIRYQYNADGRPVSYEVNGFSLKYEYDNIGFLVAVRGPDSTLYRGYTYDSAHRLIEILDASAPTVASDVSSPFTATAGAQESRSTDLMRPSGLAASWKRLVTWILAWISPAHAQKAPPMPRPVPPGRSNGQAPTYLSSPEDDLFGNRGSPNAILRWMNEGWNAVASAMDDGASSLRELATRTVKPLTCDEDPRCTIARRDAQSRYHKLVNKRLEQYMESPTPTEGHRKAVIALQDGLKDAIRRVKLYCKPLPAELPQWEEAANRDVPIRY
jgi:YD repeat-containing protein